VTRPTVTINHPNQLVQFRAHLDQHLPRFATLPGVVGITLNGGMSRGYADHLSEIDVTFYLTPEAYQHWQAGQAPIGMHIQMIDGMLYDLKMLDINHERAHDWEMVTLWDASYAQILHDPTGAVAALFANKLAQRPDPKDAAGPMFVVWWRFFLLGNAWIQRNDPLQGHMALTDSLMELIRALFLLNREYIPHEKWLVHMSYTLDWTPPDWKKRLTTALCDVAPTVESLRQRQAKIAALWQDIDRQLIATSLDDFPADLCFSQAFFYHLLTWLATNSPVSVAEWQTRAGLDMLNHAPFNLCARVENGHITLDRDRLLTLAPDDAYSWFYAVAKAVRALL
jgi:hypothetical protein